MQGKAAGMQELQDTMLTRQGGDSVRPMKLSTFGCLRAAIKAASCTSEGKGRYARAQSAHNQQSLD